MAFDTIDIGSAPLANDGEDMYTAGQKLNALINALNNGSQPVFASAIAAGTTTPAGKICGDANAASASTDSIYVQNRGVTSIGHAVGIRFKFVSGEPAATRAILTNVSGLARYGIFTSPDGTGANLTERVSVTHDGKVLIGFTSPGGSRLRVVGLPTSTAGLSSGDVWNDSGALKIV